MPAMPCAWITLGSSREEMETVRLSRRAACLLNACGQGGIQMTDEHYAIVELAECVKELCRLLNAVVQDKYTRETFEARLEKVYKKATVAKNRVDVP